MKSIADEVDAILAKYGNDNGAILPPEAVESITALMEQARSMQVVVPTYHPEVGHTVPAVNVKIEVDQGVTVTLPRMGSEDEIDVYIERKPDSWTINISPDGQEIQTVVEVTDSGEIIEGGHF